MNFDELFDNSFIPEMISSKLHKTLSKKECRAIYYYFKRKKPKNVMEVGVQYGCSTAIFLEIARWLDLEINLHSWDIEDLVKYPSKKNFTLHLENITGREKEVIKEYKPDVIFIDVHPYKLVKNLMAVCMDNKIDFMMHDIWKAGLDVARRRSNPDNKPNLPDGVDITVDVGKGTVPWEVYLIGKLIDESIWDNDYYENDDLEVKCTREKLGIGIIEFKRQL